MRLSLPAAARLLCLPLLPTAFFLQSCEKAPESSRTKEVPVGGHAVSRSSAALDLKMAAERKERLNEIADRPDASKADAADYAHSLVMLDEAIKKAKEAGVENTSQIVHKAWEEAYERQEQRRAEQRKIDQDLKAEREKREEDLRILSDKKRHAINLFAQIASNARGLSHQKGDAAASTLSFVRTKFIYCTTMDEFSDVIEEAQQRLVNAGVVQPTPQDSARPGEPEPLVIEDQ